jgi:hypothetical protein
MIMERKLNEFFGLQITALISTIDHSKINRYFPKIVVEFLSYLRFV